MIGSDIDNDALTYSATPMPTGATLVGNRFSWKPTYNQAGSYDITFNVSDGSARASKKITITVNNVNRAPIIDTTIPSSTTVKFREGYSIRFNHTSHDPDIGETSGLKYVWKLNGVEKSTAQSWLYAASVNDIGEHTVTLRVTDQHGATDTETWNISVWLRGDIQNDCKINVFDLAKVGYCFGQAVTGGCIPADIHTPPTIRGDAEGDGKINIFDLAAVGLNYGRKC